MGWFWANHSATPKLPFAPHPIAKADANVTPPVRCHAPISMLGTDLFSQPGCPMHAGSSPPSFLPLQDSISPQSSPASCPAVSPNQPIPPRDDDAATSTLSKLNPLNYMPSNISNTRDHAEQSISLPLTRSTSSIPRADTSNTRWEYPSPQQMYNAMLRKGYTDTPPDAVESMVDVHNFLNEGAWEEIVLWEEIFHRGLKEGWKKCSMGEAGLRNKRSLQEEQRARREELGLPPQQQDSDSHQPQLVRFQGRPKEMTPKAGILQALGWVWPSKFGSEPPFDRHDWYVTRPGPSGTAREVRYVIDYYSGDPEPTGEPVFYLDIRPAIDAPTAMVERLMRWGGDVWYRASGAAVREQQQE